MGNLGTWDWVIILGIVVLLFGAKRLPELAKGIGKSIHSFKQGMQDVESDITKDVDKKNT